MSEGAFANRYMIGGEDDYSCTFNAVFSVYQAEGLRNVRILKKTVELPLDEREAVAIPSRNDLWRVTSRESHA